MSVCVCVCVMCDVCVCVRVCVCVCVSVCVCVLGTGVATRAGQEEGREARDYFLLLGRVWAPEECDGNFLRT